MPDNAGYMHAAYAVAATAYVLYALSLWRRRRALRAEEETRRQPERPAGGTR